MSFKNFQESGIWNFLQRRGLFLIGLLLSLSLLWPLVAAPYFVMQDDIQTIRLYEMDKCIKDGQIPCRWVPDLGGEYGYPLFNYYAPLPYYYGEIFYLISGSLIWSAKIMFATAFLGAFIFMYLLGKRLWEEAGGVISAVFYSFAPYHAVDFYVRGDLEELWSLMFFPALFWAMWRLKDKTSVLNILLVTVFTAGLLLSHNLSAMIFAPFIVLFGLILLWQKYQLREKKGFLNLAKFLIIGGGLGILLSSFYWLPALVEKPLVHVDTTTMGYFGYTEHFKGLYKLLVSRFWGWGSSVREIPGGAKDGMSFQIGWAQLIGWLMALVAAKILWSRQKLLSLVIILASLGILVSIFMIHPRSAFIWAQIPLLKFLQFPWRFLELIIFFISLVSGSIFLVVNNKIKPYLWLGLVILAVALNFYYFRPQNFLWVTDHDLLTGKIWDTNVKRSIFDFLPIYAEEPPAELVTVRYQILGGIGKISDFEEGTNWIQFKASVSNPVIIRLSEYYFPDWQIQIDGQNVNIDYKNHLGLMTFIIPSGDHQITARLFDSAIRTIANLISLLALIIVGVLALLQIKKVKDWLSYYLGSLLRR